MPTVRFGPWTPDGAAFQNPGLLTATNALPGINSYRPVQSLQSTSTALAGRPRGAIAVKDSNNVLQAYAGDAAALYRLVGSTWTDATRLVGGAYTTGETEVWEFVRWAGKVLAVNWNDDPQQITIGDANFTELTTAFRARHVGVVRDFVVVGNTFDASDGNRIDRIRWSAINDETDWTVSPVTLSDFRDLRVGGPVQKIVGGEFGVIVSESAVHRMSFTGTQTVFQLDEVLSDIGAIAPGTVSRIADTVYFWSERGFVALRAGTQVRLIGANKVDEFARADLDTNNLHRISANAARRSGLVMWAYPGAGNSGGLPNKILVYDTKTDQWSLIEEDVELLWNVGSVGLTLEELNAISPTLEGLPASLDSERWKGGSIQLAAFLPDFTHGFFSGSPMAATFDTGDIEIHGGARTTLNGFRPMVAGGVVTAQVAGHGQPNKPADQAMFGPALTLSSTGRFTPRSNARFHRFRLKVSGEWSDAIGIQVDRHDAKRGELRG